MKSTAKQEEITQGYTSGELDIYNKQWYVYHYNSKRVVTSAARSKKPSGHVFVKTVVSLMIIMKEEW